MKRTRARRGAALICGVALFGTALAMPAAAAKPTKPSKPGAPTITAVKAGFHSVKVTFDKPADNGGAKIVNYRVVCTSSNGGRKGANEGPRSPIKVSGLTTGKTYTCTVSAKNKVGRGPASAPSDSFVPTPKKP
jgi:extracellular elastinolytic metalloproteinase